MEKAPEANDVVEQLGNYSRRIFETVEHATALHAVFRVLAEAQDGREDLVGPIARAFNTIQHALLRESVLIIVRLFDRPRNLAKSDKVSFPVIREWINQDGVATELLDRARSRHGEKWSRRNVALTHRSIRRLQRRLDDLAAEKPNRERLLRNFRDDFLAHELQHEIPRELPQLQHVREMLGEIQLLTIDSLFACSGHEIDFEHVTAEAEDGAEQIWRALRDRPFSWHPKLGIVEADGSQND